MYPHFREVAEFEGNLPAANEAQHQIEESKRHASEFKEVLKKAEKRFAALAKVEQRHAEAYQAKLDELNQVEAR
jgi:rubrerythrin